MNQKEFLAFARNEVKRSKRWRTTQGNEFDTAWNLVMAASLVAMLPIIILFFFGQKYFIQGVVFTGVEK